MRHLGLFEGIGGFMLAAEWMGWDHVAWVEWDKKAQQVFKKNFPNVKGYGDIKEFNGSEYRGKVDIITGGFPCQPFSNAGKRKGKDDDRYLWPEMLRVIREIKPSFVVGENVAGLVTMENGKTLDDILTDLENEGYTIESFIIPACAVQAWHRRDRIWIIAYFNKNSKTENRRGNRKSREQQSTLLAENERRHGSPIFDIRLNNLQSNSAVDSYTRSKRKQRFIEKKIPKLKGIQRGENIGIYARISNRSNLLTPVLCRSYDGLPGGMDRIKQLGNAIVPQVAYELFKAIEQLNKIINKN